MKNFLLLIAMLALAQINTIACYNESNVYHFTYAGKTYEIVKERLSWVDAAACAAEKGGCLTHINNQEEQDSITWHLFNQSGVDTTYTDVPDGGQIAYIWIGANDDATEGTWVWNGDNGSSPVHFWTGIREEGSVVNNAYINWGTNLDGTLHEPDNYQTQNAGAIALETWPNQQNWPNLHYGRAGEWNDIDINNTLYYIIEYDAQTGTNSLESTDYNSDVSIYPNPAQDFISLEGTINEVSYSLTNMQGSIVQHGNSESSTIYIADLNQGVYRLNLYLESGAISQTLIKL